MSSTRDITPATPRAAWRALALLTCARTAMGFQFQSIASVGASLGSEFALSQAELGTLIGLYFLPGIVLAVPGGALGARFGDKRLVLTGLGLMAAGGLVSSLAVNLGWLTAGRLMAGVGGVLLNVLMTKMVADWFAGRTSLFLAMAVFVNSFPIGVGLATLVLGPLAASVGWRVAIAATVATAIVALGFMSLVYVPHPNDGRGAATASVQLTRREVVLVSVAGAIWGLFNGVFAVMVGLVPQVGLNAGIDAAEVRLAGSIATWLLVASVLAGGALAPRYATPGFLLAFGALAWAACLSVVALHPTMFSPAMVAAGLVMGLPVGTILSLPARVLRPESRGLGMGLFFTWLYLGHGFLPPIAGLLQDRSGAVAAAAWLAAVLAAAMAALYAAFLVLDRSSAEQR